VSRNGAALGAAALIFLAGGSPSRPERPGQDPGRVVRARYLMGTVFRFEAPAGRDAAATAAALEAGLDEVGRWEKILSNWDPGSETSRLNARRGMGMTRVTPELFRAVTSSLQWARATGGAFDPTLEPLTRAFRHQAPVESFLSQPQKRPRWTDVEVDARRGWVAIPPRSGLDFGGIGKGFALDEAAGVLRRRGVADALLDAGGQLLALGAPPGEPGWRIGVADPEHRDRSLLSLILKNASAATSGNAERPGEILDPVTGRPIPGSASATAIAPLATSADALSTALFVMGPQRGTAYARGRDDLVAVFVQPTSRPEGGARVLGNLPADPVSTHFIILGPEDPHDRRLRVEAR
jgi:thiamine biosynthesis lipoprotein